MRENVSDFTRGVMDRIRDFSGIPPLDDIRQPDGSWRYVLPSGERRFKIVPHRKLVTSLNGGDWAFVCHVQNEYEANEAISDYLRGV